MTLNTLGLHNAVKSRLGAQLIEAYVTDGQPTGGRYAVLFPGNGNAYRGRLSEHVDYLDWSETIMCAGPTTEDALDVLDQVRAALVGYDLEPGNLACSLLEEVDDEAPLIPSTTVEGDPRYSITKRYRVSTNR